MFMGRYEQNIRPNDAGGPSVCICMVRFIIQFCLQQVLWIQKNRECGGDRSDAFALIKGYF